MRNCNELSNYSNTVKKFILKEGKTYQQELLYRMKAGEEAAFRQIFDQYKDRLFTYCCKVTKSEVHAEEIVHDVFLKIWQLRHTIDPNLGIDAFLFTITKNLALNYLEKTAREHKGREQLKSYFQQLRHKNHTEDMIVSDEYQKLLKKAIELLPPQRKLVFRMSRFEGMSHAEIATALCLSPGTIKNHMIHALKFLKRYFQVHSDLTLLLFFLCQFFSC